MSKSLTRSAYSPKILRRGVLVLWVPFAPLEDLGELVDLYAYIGSMAFRLLEAPTSIDILGPSPKNT